MNFKTLIATLMVAAGVSFSPASQAQSSTCTNITTSASNSIPNGGIVSEDFTCNASSQQWFFFNGACLTAGTSTSLTSPGGLPACTTVMTNYYNVAGLVAGKSADAALVGGERGYLGSSTAPSSATAVVADDNGSGALRFTNGKPGGYFERGAIVSNYTFPTGQGVQITFKTVAYYGDSGGAGGDGADGISFFLMDGCMPIAGGTVPSGCTTTNPIYGTGNTFPAIGATGGSLAYSCSNQNSPFDGLVGAYLGLGIDEFGNFLNGTNNTLGETGTSATGDNTASGGGYQPGRIGLRGAGSVSWQALTTAYGTLSSTGPYYPASLATTCSNGGVYSSSTNTCGVACTSGTLNSASNTCDICATGYTFSQSGNTCGSCNSGATYDPSTNTCSPAYTCSVGTYDPVNSVCSATCPSGSTFNSTANKCGSCSSGTPDFQYWTSNQTAYCDNVCPNNYTYESAGTTYPNVCLHCTSGGTLSSTKTTTNGTTITTWSCSGSGSQLRTKPLLTASTSAPNAVTPTPTLATQNPTTQNPITGAPIFTSAVQKTCSTGRLWNYSNPTAPVDAGAATLPTDPTTPNALNTAGILDYNAIASAFSVIPTPTQDPKNGFLIAAEGSTTRASAAPILYNLKITQDGLLSLSYSYNGGSTVPVISNQNILKSNGNLPGSFRFGFAGSTGGDTNVHEILCFKAAPVENTGSSGAINVYHDPNLHTGTQIFIANYFPSDWTGQLEAFPINVVGGVPTIGTPNWDARCVLSGVDANTGVCDATGASGPAAETPSSRVMLTWDPVGLKAEAFEWGGITSAQQTALTAGDSTQTANRLAYLRGDRTNEITTSGSGLYRARNAVLSDIVDSSPVWVGPPQKAYTLVGSWVDMLNQTTAQPENATGAQKYSDYISTTSSTGQGIRENIVYAGANDGFLHGFRAGAMDVNGNLVTSTYANDGQEVLAYMPATVLNTIHNSTTAALDFSNTQYSHNWYVDATPAQGDVFYGSKWHTWVVSGLGPGGAAIFALDVTDPTQFSESNPSKTVLGEWTPSNLTCANDPTTPTPVTHCGAYLGNTYGSPLVRRFHSGQWGFIFGNGYGTTSGASGIYIALLDKTTGAPTFYWFSTGYKQGTTIVPNGIASTFAADLDLDNTVDYIYAGDLQGNVWRFDVTGSSPSSWGVSASSPLFKAGSSQPITTQVLVSTIKTITTTVNSVGLNVSNAPERVVVTFGTGQQVPQTLSSAASYASGSQFIYGVWDWDMTEWNGLQTFQPAIGLTTSPGAISETNMQAQTLTETAGPVVNGVQTGGTATLTHTAVCWSGSTTCNSGNTMLGWYIQLVGTNEQIIYNPLGDPTTGAVVFNTYIPSPSGVLSCSQVGATGYSLGMDAGTGEGLPLALFNVGGVSYDGVQTNAAGTGSVINAGEAGGGKNYLTTHDSTGKVTFTQMNNYTVTTGSRVYWIQKR